MGLLMATTILGTATAQAAGGDRILAQDNIFEFAATPVGLAAVGFGVVGMLAGVLRRKKIEIQPENQRKG
ncbi:hypothetical protein [Saccharopolyspora gloriosae]|uniref:hypothetical protein n=1 Tax=Saccharopolyspora gloriosae TaxID=455344 RepID=UPI001FB7225E|nr:hypothetical protein [Saccharopolyspora gloriosae]